MEEQNPKILVVDDTEDNLDLLEFAMKRKPVVMLRATSGKECLQIARKELPDIILLDIQMPEMDGFETLQHLHEDPVTAGIPVVFLTAQRKDPKSIQKGLEMGAEEFLTKWTQTKIEGVPAIQRFLADESQCETLLNVLKDADHERQADEAFGGQPEEIPY